MKNHLLGEAILERRERYRGDVEITGVKGRDHKGGHRKKTYRVTAALPALRAGRTARENIMRETAGEYERSEEGRGEQGRGARWLLDLIDSVAMAGKCEVELLALYLR